MNISKTTERDIKETTATRKAKTPLVGKRTKVFVGISVLIVLFAFFSSTSSDSRTPGQKAADASLSASQDRIQGIDSEASDKERAAALDTIVGGINRYKAQFGYYPNGNDINDKTWRNTYLPGVSSSVYDDPDGGNSGRIMLTPTLKAYSYQTIPTYCTNTASNLCAGFRLSAYPESQFGPSLERSVGFE